MFLLKLALRPWRMAPFSQLFTAGAVGLLLFLAGMLFWLERSLVPVVGRLQGEQVVTAYLDPALEARDETRVVDSIRTSLGAQAVDVKLVRSQGFINEVKPHYPELARELEELGGETTSLIPRYVSLSGILPADAAEKVRQVPGVESAETSRDRYHHIVGAFRTLGWVARLLAIGLGAALLTGLVQLARMNSYLHQDAVSLLRLWGGTPLALRTPGIISALIVGTAGGALAAGAWLSGGTWLGGQIRSLSPMLREMALPQAELALALVAAGILLGLVAGAFGKVRG